MKPDFALNLSHDGIGLLHRQDAGWLSLGEVSLESPDLAGELAKLRKRAEAVAGRNGLMTKLVIPASQVLYTEVTVSASSAPARRRKITESLEGRTPYPVEQLVFDWSGEGDVVRVAVVARETLEEAESFAQTYGFAPIAFVARPENGSFDGEPWFGLTSVAASYLPEGARVERDDTPVEITGTLPPAEVSGDMAPDARNIEIDLPAIEQTADELSAQIAAASGSAESASSDADGNEASEGGPTAEISTVAPASDANPATSDPQTPADAATAGPDVITEDPALPAFASRRTLAADVGADDAAAIGTATAGDTPPPATPAPHRLTLIAEPKPTRLDANPKPLDMPASRPVGAPEGAVPSGAIGVTAPGLALPEAEEGAAPGKETTAATSIRKAARKSIASAAKGTAALGGSARKILNGKPPAAPPQDAPPAMVQAANKTVFGASRQEIGGKPRRLGLMLTGALVLFLVIVALWSVFLRDAEPVQEAEAPIADPSPAPIPQEVADAPVASPPPVPTETETAEAVAPPVLRASTEETAAPVATVEETPAEKSIAATDESELATPEPEARSDAMSTAETAPEPRPAQPVAAAAETPEQKIEPAPAADLASSDAPPPASLPPLPEVNLNLAALSSAMLRDATEAEEAAPATERPAPASVEPTPAPDLSAEGETLLAGQPPEQPAPTAQPDEAASDIPYADPALAGLAPKPRPEAVIRAAAEAATGQETDLSPEERAEIARLGALMPRARPAAILAAAEAQALDAAAADAEAAIAALAAEAADPFASATERAIAASQRPADKPDNLRRIVAAAQAAPQAPETNASARTVEPTSFSAPAQPDEIDEPEPTSAAPTLPTSASVAKQATVKNGIKLGEMNLIGLFGSSQNRRALVRMSNGRFVKVGIGDRLDGGQVTAIGDGQLTYKKGSRSYTLKLLKGS